jgi:hypothetical protein
MPQRPTSAVLYFGGFSTLAAGQAPPLSAPGCFGLYMERDTNNAMISVNGGAWLPLAGAFGSGGWTDDGTNVRLTTATDTVSIGTAVPIAGTKLVLSAPQLVTGGVDTTQGIDLTMVRTAALAAGEFVTAIAIHPTGNAGDNGAAFVTGIFADVPTGPANHDVIFMLGSGANVWTHLALGNDTDMVIENARQTGGAPDDIVLRSNVAATPSGDIRSETVVGGATVVHWSVDDVLGFRARSRYARSGVIRPTTAVSVNDFAPAGLANASWIILGQTAGANINITGLTGGSEGRRVTLTNASDVATNTITLTHEDAASTAANRFHNEDLASIVIPRGASVELEYDATLARWRPLYT